MSKPKVFISGTSRDLKSYRTGVAKWAEQRGYDPVVQDDFPVQSDFGTVVQLLREKIDPCDAVIHLAGLFYGFEPKNRPDGEARRSYTQLEFELGKEHRRQVFRFIAREDFQADQSLAQIEAQLLSEIPGFTADEFRQQCEMQRHHRRRLTRGCEAWSATSRTTGNELYYEFSNREELHKLLDQIEIKATLAKPQNLPLVGSLFKGRDEFIEQLRSVLINKPTHIAAVTAKQAIHGLGGVGKTRVAVEYAKRYSHEYTASLFVTADNPANLQRNLANLCGALILDLPEKDAVKQEVQVAAALRWLREHSGWFLIVDNVDTPDAAEAVESLLQKLNSGHVVVTSRLSHWGDAVQELSLDVISEPAAQEFLLERTNGKRKSAPTDEADSLTLAIELGRLPLALEQAGAFIVKHRTDFQGYLDRWKRQEAKVLQWHDQLKMKYPASVATTWQASFDQLTADGRSLLNVLCWLAPDPIPVKMIEKLSSTDGAPPIDVEAGIADLAEYSLLKWTDDQYESVEVHRLVQEITRYRLPKSDHLTWLALSQRMVNDFVPFEPTCDDLRSWPTIYDPGHHHIAAILQFLEKLGNGSPGAGSLSSTLWRRSSRLMNCLAGYLFARAEFQQAEPLMRRALAINECIYGMEHPEVSTALNSLAILLKTTNRLPDAEPLLRRAIAIDERTYGAEHLEVAKKRNNLAQLLQDTNRLPEAEQIMVKVLESFGNHYGENHPNVAIALSNLASLLLATNRLVEAEPLMRRALAIDEESYEPDDPKVAADLNNLASLLVAMNRLPEAEPLMMRVVNIFEKSYGENHPYVATGLSNLASVFQNTNRAMEAEPLMRRALAIHEHSYGKEHPEVALILNNLAQLLLSTNRLEEAEPLLDRALAIDEQSYGEDHPNVALRLSKLVGLLLVANRPADAEPLMRRALAIHERSHGKDHPSVAKDLNNLASVLQAMNRFTDAAPLLEAAFQIFRRSLGEDHPNTQVAFHNLKWLLIAKGQSEEEALVTIRSKLRGDEQ